MKFERTVCQYTEERYVINQNDGIVLYGYNEYCKQQVTALLNRGYDIVGIVDKAKPIQEYEGIKIVSSIADLNVTKKNIVFIMLQNGMLHWDIAFDVYQYGLNKILFLPMCKNNQDNVALELILQYNYMLNGDYAIMQVPYLSERLFKRGDPKYRIAKELDNGEFIIWLSVDLIRTSFREGKYKDVLITEFLPYRNLFLLLSGKCGGDIREYIRLYGKAPYPADSEDAYNFIVEKRKVLYDFFESKYYEGNLEYFEVAAPRALYNPKGYVNLCEGQHRCVYLTSKGMVKVPIRVTADTLRKLNDLK